MQPKRIYMNEEGSSPGGGAPPAAPAAPPANNGAPPAEPAVPVSQLKAVIGEVFGELKNGLFADLRRSGALGKDKPTTESPATPQPQSPSAAAPAPSGLSMADVEAVLAQDRAIMRAEIENKLTEKQVARMRAALKADKPDDVGAWAAAYLSDMGIAKAATEPSTQVQTTAPNLQAAQPGGLPISDKGSPAPGGVTNWEREFADNPIGMSAAAYSMMEAKYGVEKARRMRVEAATRQGANIRVLVKPQQR